MTAFDALRPPSDADLDTCVHCGFCLPTCPTYVLWGEEMDSPRGRIVLMDAAAHDADAISDAMATHWDRCLGCMACVSSCPSGVRYDRLLEDTRPQLERNYRRPLRERLVRRLAFATFTHPGRLRWLAPLAGLAGRLGARRLGRRLPDSSRTGALLRLTPRVRVRTLARVPEFTQALGERRGRVGLLQGCVQRVFFGDVNAATAEVLAAEGWEVAARRSPRCCGALMLHTGAEPEALALARETIAAFEDCDTVVANAAGCGSSMRDYARLLADDPAWAGPAAAFSAKVVDVTVLLAASEPRAPRGPVELRVAYHDACHLAHAQGVRAEPRALLHGIPGLELVEPPEWELCCGSAGLYNVLQPAAAAELGRRKAVNLAAMDADAIAAGNPGCALQVATYLEELGRPVPILHPVELVRASLRVGTGSRVEIGRYPRSSGSNNA